MQNFKIAAQPLSILQLWAFFSTLVFLSPSSHTRAQSVCDTAYQTSPSRALRLPPLVRLKCPDLSRGDRNNLCFLFDFFFHSPPVCRESRRGPASSSTSGTASRSPTPTWAGPMTAYSTSTERLGFTEWRPSPRTARDLTAACCFYTSPVRGWMRGVVTHSCGRPCGTRPSLPVVRIALNCISGSLYCDADSKMNVV